MSVSGVTTIYLSINQDAGEDDTLDRRLRQRVPIPAKIQQLRTAIEQRGRHSTGHNQLYVKEMCCTE